MVAATNTRHADAGGQEERPIAGWYHWRGARTTIDGLPEGCTDVPKRTKRLKMLSSADFTKPFTNPCTDQIEVNRPLESVANNPTIKHDQGEGKVR